jgi:predicted glutamine amidotransferase
MCQLLGMNSNVPTDICFSFEGFCARGGKTDHHQDGWGIAFFEGFGCRLFLDDNPSIASPIAELVKKYPIKSTNIIAHIRKATQGDIGLENCHPFQRELWGQYWVFAHNGHLENFVPELTGIYQPVGNTDSEKAFCLILETLKNAFPDGSPSLEKLYFTLQEITQFLSAKGIFNYLLSNGEYFFAHCTTQLHYLIRQAPFAAAHLIDEDITVDFQAWTGEQDCVAIIATLPLTDNETWTPFAENQLLVFQDGAPVIFNN